MLTIEQTTREDARAAWEAWRASKTDGVNRERLASLYQGRVCVAPSRVWRAEARRRGWTLRTSCAKAAVRYWLRNHAEPEHAAAWIINPDDSVTRWTLDGDRFHQSTAKPAAVHGG